MRRDAAASGAMGVDQRLDLRFDAGLRERIDHDLPLPGGIGVWPPMLDRAAAAGAEIAAERRDPLRARLLDTKQRSALRMAGCRADLDCLAAERVGHEQAPAFRMGHAIAAMADMIDIKAFSHGARR